MSRYAEDLKKIVGVDEIKRKLKELEDGQAIESKRGVAYQSGSTGQVQSDSGAGGSGGIQAPTGAAGSGLSAIQQSTSDAARNALNGMSGSNGFSAGQSPIKQAEDGVLDVGDVLDGYADNALTGGGATGFGPNLSGLNGWSDCTNDEPGTVRFDSYVPPIGWDSINEPPLDTSWIAGKYWLFGSAFYGSTFSALISDALAHNIVLRSNPSSTNPGYLYGNSTDPSAGATLAGYDLTQLALNGDNTVPSYVGFVYITSGTSGYGPAGTCPMPAGYSCQLVQPYDTTWDADSFQVLLNKDTGLFETNQYDPKAPEIYNTPSSSVYMCFGEGRTATLTAGAGNTKLLYETDPTTGAPLAGTYLHIYDNKGQIKGYADVALIDQYSP